MKKIQLNVHIAYDIGYLQGYNDLPFNFPKEVFGSISKAVNAAATRGYQSGQTDRKSMISMTPMKTKKA